MDIFPTLPPTCSNNNCKAFVLAPFRDPDQECRTLRLRSTISESLRRIPMLASNRPSRQMFAQSRERSSFKNASLVRAAAFFAIIVLLAGSSYFISTAADSHKGARSQKAAAAVGESGKVAKVNSVEAWNSSGFPSLTPTFSTLLPLLQAQTEPIATYAADCTTRKTDFNLGDTVCAKATGVPDSVFPWKVLWLDP